MALSAGSRLGPYEILAPVGEGGMGTVYRARDSRLGRTVAIKVLREHVDPEQRQRLEREARVVGSLSHPHICALFDVGDHDGIFFLVLEFLDGETLAARLKRGPLPLGQTLEYAAQVCDALDCAHRHGLIHRDLKPGNIMLTGGGAKLLDFGLAKPLAAAGPEDTTLSLDLTKENIILGTPHYMAPEQLQGKPADARSDLFAAGVVMYEMASGRKAFEGPSRADLIAAIMSGEMPPFEDVTSTGLQHVISSCLAKDPDSRWQSARDLVLQLRWIKSSSTVPPAPVPRQWPYLWMAAAGLAIFAAIVIAVLYRPRAAPSGPPYRFLLYPPEKSSFHSFALSPDGRRMAFSATTAGHRALWLLAMDSVAPRQLSGTEDGYNPFFSPDGRFVAFFTLGRLKKIDLGLPSGPASPETLFTGDTHAPASGTWNSRGVILFAPSVNLPLFQIPETGGSRVPATALDRSRQEARHTSPQFLPDGERFLFGAIGVPDENTGIYAGSLSGQDVRRLMRGSSSSSYVAVDGRGYLLFLRGGALAAQAFDTGRLELKGDPFVIAERVGAYAVSNTDVLAYSEPTPRTMQLSWFDRQGRATEAFPLVSHDVNDVAISPDGKRAVVRQGRIDGGGGDLWLVDLPGPKTARFTFHPEKVQGCPVWSPDGGSLVYHSNWEGQYNLFSRASNGAGGEVAILPPGNSRCPTSWSRDGRFLVFQEYDSKGKTDLWVLPMHGDRKPFRFMETEFSERQGQFSPNGQWIAYTSDATGEREVYVRPFRGGPVSIDSEGQWQISAHGGHSPKWRPDGKELYYIAGNRKLMAVEIEAGASFHSGQARSLFEPDTWVTGSNFVYRYDVSPDGQKFLMSDVIEETIASPITVLLNWTSVLKK